jgi:hypothetical protein
MNPLPVSGTLIVAAPCQDGLVVSADSLSTLDGGRAVPARIKLHAVPGVNGTIFTITGVGTWMPPLPPGEDLEKWMLTATPAFTVVPIVQNALTIYGDRSLEHQPLVAIGQQVAASIMKYFGHGWLTQHRGKRICQLVVFRYERTSRVSSRFKCVFVGDTNGMHMREVEVERLSHDEIFSYWTAGEESYVKTNVESRSGFARPVWERLLDGKFLSALPKISDTQREDAVLLTTSLIAATEQATKKVAAGAAVGGKPVTWFLTGDAPPLSIPPAP